MPLWFALILVLPGIRLIRGAFCLLRRQTKGPDLLVSYAKAFIRFFAVVLFFNVVALFLPAPRRALSNHDFMGIWAGIAWLMAYPIFLRIWFSRKKIKDEVRSWGELKN